MCVCVCVCVCVRVCVCVPPVNALFRASVLSGTIALVLRAAHVSVRALVRVRAGRCVRSVRRGRAQSGGFLRFGDGSNCPHDMQCAFQCFSVAAFLFFFFCVSVCGPCRVLRDSVA